MRAARSIVGAAIAVLTFAGPASGESPRRAPLQLAGGAIKPIKERDADQALREALVQAADAATARLSHAGAFAERGAYRVELPGALQELRGSWNAVGRSGALDRLQAAMNRAAEMSAPHARAPLEQAIAEIDFSDAVAIVRSGDEAGSQFLALRTRAGVESALRPFIVEALSAAGAFAALGEAGAAAGVSQRAKDYRASVIDATADREMDALFAEMRIEERAIRRDPNGRGSPLLRMVFSSAGARCAPGSHCG